MTVMLQSEFQEPEQELKSVGLKATVPRMKILEIFQKAKSSGERHLCAEDVYRILSSENMDVGLATVYRVLTQFEQAGILVRHHFKEIEKRQRQIAQRLGFDLESHALSLYGVCSECRQKEQQKKKLY